MCHPANAILLGHTNTTIAAAINQTGKPLGNSAANRPCRACSQAQMAQPIAKISSSQPNPSNGKPSSSCGMKKQSASQTHRSNKRLSISRVDPTCTAISATTAPAHCAIVFIGRLKSSAIDQARIVDAIGPMLLQLVAHGLFDY